MKKIILSFLAILPLLTALQAETPYDFDGDGKTDKAVFHTEFANPDPNNLVGQQIWYLSKSSDGLPLTMQWGHVTATDTDLLRPADFDGDGKTDFAVQRIVSGQSLTTFYILNSSDNTIRAEIFGRASENSKVIGDYDGDGKADLCVYGVQKRGYGFTYKGSFNNPNGILTVVPFGNRIATPYRGDFDGDNKLDFCVRFTTTNPTAVFTLKRSSDGVFENVNWGLNADSLAPGDYDGDGRTDFCVRRSNGTSYEWYILERDGGGTGANPIYFGSSNFATRYDMPFSETDFDGNGRSDLGVYADGQNNQGVFLYRDSAPNSWIISFPWRNGPQLGDGPIYTYLF